MTPPPVFPAGAGVASKFFPVYHVFNEGKADDWWAAMMKMTPDDMAARPRASSPHLCTTARRDVFTPFCFIHIKDRLRLTARPMGP